MKLFAQALSVAAACAELGHMSSTATLPDCIETIAASAMTDARARVLNNNANTNTRIDGWAGV
ncbi:hypothetical protein ACXU4B_04560 [Dyella soli]|uniref:Uncharacterized protein n=1 Tax=Dyella soli TaxID=522319 RepID=A0A4R0YVD0_9GAMM|nr:hypothetical protein [Dyella soli]TCI10290.1 hypothetical protein EZM97_15445 [Dyella soli]